VEIGGFATRQARYKFNTGMERLNILIKRASRSTPDTSQHLRALRDRLAHPDLSLDHREDGDVDVEKTRVWKFRFLDLIIGMVLDGGGMARMEVANVLLYAEAVVRGMSGEMDVKGKGKGTQLKVIKVEGKGEGKLSVTDGSEDFARDRDMMLPIGY
jgi:hypothetical protein